MSSELENSDVGGDEQPAEEDQWEQGEEEQHPHKRQRQTVQENPFKVGTIKKIRVHNFMTYSGTVTITPGPRLNLVLGPNGTGKSSLVCALCIGMAGSPKRLGRADNLGDFVRRNCSETWTEITLSGGDAGRDVVIRRDIKLKYRIDQDGQRVRSYDSSFQIDRAPCTMKQVTEKVAQFNIQFDNLCQFLPQDMVVEFARMNSYELLVATMKAMGDSQLERDHATLMEMRRLIKDIASELNRKSGRLQGLEVEHQEQHRDYERYAQRERLLEEVKLIKHKLHWLEVKANNDVLREAKDHFATSKQAFEEVYNEAKDEDGPIKKLEMRLQNLAKTHRKEEGDTRQVEKWLLGLNNNIDKDKQRADDQIQKIENLHKESDKHKSDIARLQHSVQSLEAELVRTPASLPAELVQRQRELQAEQRDLHSRLGQVEEDEQEIRSQGTLLMPRLHQIDAELSKMSNVRLMRLKRLEATTRRPGITNTYDFVQQNRGMFKGPVLGPIGVEMDVKDPKWVAFVEKQCGAHLLNYCVTCEEDEKVMTRFMTENKYTFSVYVFQGNFHVPVPHPLGDASAYSDFGILHTLDQTFDAPNLIKHVLATNSRTNTVYIGEEQAQQASEDLFARTQVRDLYTLTSIGMTKMSRNVSRYNTEGVYTNYEFVQQPSKLVHGTAASEADSSIATLQMQKTQLQQAVQELQKKLEQAGTSANDIRTHLQRVMVSLNQIANKKRENETTKARKEQALTMERNRLSTALKKPDPLVNEDRLRQELQAMLGTMYQQAQQQVGLLADLWNKTKRVIAASLAVKETETQVAALKQVTRERKEELRTRKADMETWSARVQKAKEIFDRSKAQAAREYPRNEETDAQCADLSDDPAELQDLQTQKTAEAQSIVCNNENVIREYKNRQTQIDALKAEVAIMRGDLDGKQKELDELKQKWLPELQELVAHINSKFSQSFAGIGSAGEVSLREHDDFDKYAIEIRVKFRHEEDLQLLTGTRQSGGERSVSTILYLIALQEITWTPFRVVDEINQGMDPVNERRVFSLLVESSCQPGTPQCFLLTPKLLPGLPMGEGITVLGIMNGHGIDKDVIASSNRGLGLMMYGKRYTDCQQRLQPAVAAG
ncbi:P-loop containing nucleoside triphosphate hydrolase protein [Dunaliella salina]|uniref:Structural maintenance of chromosomes protein 5 n=1 Tax=Dunaliella salina TaxID=3046 RepID=A0ABQ7GBF8_DUNSA|nr:P-loop containing nucleoside triphosphate hydrolase protein [Dunaliella salina]|eukprot:KAF5831942.1 P-loop containing nucleoside triphosphate hydrolase protein [Dunaliella salina]